MGLHDYRYTIMYASVLSFYFCRIKDIQLITQHSTSISIEILPFSLRITQSAHRVFYVVGALVVNSGISTDFLPSVRFATYSDLFSTAGAYVYESIIVMGSRGF